MEQTRIFMAATPGLETPLRAELEGAAFSDIRQVPGGFETTGGLAEAVRANRELRCTPRVLLRLAEFRAVHLAQLDKRARRVDWRGWLSPDVPVRVEAVCRRSKIYVNKAAVQRIAGAIEAGGVKVSKEAELVIKARIEDDLCTISIDTTGEALHRRGHKTFVGKAPLRETMAACFLRMMGFDGHIPVLDPMCGSGTIVLEAAEIASGLLPGRTRRFAFEQLAGFEPAPLGPAPKIDPPKVPLYQGFDRNDGAIRGARGNAAQAGLEAVTLFERRAISDFAPADGLNPGLILVNPPYGGRIGDRSLLFGLYGSLGTVLKERFAGWRIGIVTSDGGLAKATQLPLTPSDPIDHSGTKVKLWQAVL